MNLKESFRYQNFLENMLAYAGNSTREPNKMNTGEVVACP